jgi:hypothetical protein
MSIVATVAIKATGRSASRFMQFLPFPNHSLATSIRDCDSKMRGLCRNLFLTQTTASDRELPRF